MGSLIKAEYPFLMAETMRGNTAQVAAKAAGHRTISPRSALLH
jgi:hypothetical protein